MVRTERLHPEDAELASSGTRPPTLRERDLPGHLRGDGEVEAGGAAAATPESNEALDDFAVREALNLLKGLSVFRKSGVKAG